MGSDSLLSHLINTNVRCMRLFQWFYDVELCMDMNTSYSNTIRLFPAPRFALPNPLPEGEGVSGTAVAEDRLIKQTEQSILTSLIPASGESQ